MTMTASTRPWPRLFPLLLGMLLASGPVRAHQTVTAPAVAGTEQHDHSTMQGHDEQAGSAVQHDHSKAEDHDGHDEHAAHLAAAGGKAGREADVRVTLHDDPLVTHLGKPVQFVADVLGDKLVAVTIAYTSCTTVCPVTSVIFSQVQSALGARMEREVRLVTITVDPVTDTPPRLRKYATRHGVKDGWVWLTGDKSYVDHVLTGLGAYTPEYEEHPIMVLVGDPMTGKWSRLFGFPPPETIVAELDALSAARAHANHTTSGSASTQ